MGVTPSMVLISCENTIIMQRCAERLLSSPFESNKITSKSAVPFQFLDLQNADQFLKLKIRNDQFPQLKKG